MMEDEKDIKRAKNIWVELVTEVLGADALDDAERIFDEHIIEGQIDVVEPTIKWNDDGTIELTY